MEEKSLQLVMVEGGDLSPSHRQQKGDFFLEDNPAVCQKNFYKFATLL
jgi:hypothetical protein